MQRRGFRKRRRPIHIGRYGEILSILVKYGFGDFIANLNFERYISFTRKFVPGYFNRHAGKRTSRWERIRLALEELGPTFIKFGQHLSSRHDLFPSEFIAELEKLQDNVKPCSFSELADILAKDLKVPSSELFEYINEVPFASASIAQVHKAVLKTGELVAVKIQRPRIKEVIATDIDILFNFTSVVQKRYERFRLLHLDQLVHEFKRTIEKELDFTIEASHLDRFRRDFSNHSAFYFPKVFHEATSKHVLSTEFIEGIKVSDVEAIEKANIDRKLIAQQGSDFILSQIFDHGFFHADPHPGNIIIKENGTICFIDFGAVGILPPSIRYQLSIILFGVVKKDPQRIIRALSQLSTEQIADREQLEYDIMEFIEEYSLLLLKQINIQDIMGRFAALIINHELKIIPGFYLLMRTLMTTEAIGRRLDPDFNMMDRLTPFVKKLIGRLPRVRPLSYDLFFTVMDLASLAKDLPFEIKELMRMLKSGELNILFEHRGLEPVVFKFDQFVNKIVLALILGSLIIGSSVVVHSGIPPVIYDIPLIGVAGFSLAGLIGFWLIFAILREKKF